MAFGGILLLNAFLMILLGLACLGVVCVITAIVLAFLHFRAKRKGITHRKVKAVLSIILAVVGILCILPFAAILCAGTQPDYVSITTNQGTVELQEDITRDFVDTIQTNDTEGLAHLLRQYPALLDYVTFEGYTPLGASIRYDAPDVTRYLLELGVDVDHTGREPSIALACRMSDMPDGRLNAEIIRILLDHDPDVNTTDNAMPPVQYIIRYITEDSEISIDDLSLMEKFMAHSPNLTVTNGTGQDARAYFESCVEAYQLPADQQSEIEAIRSLLNSGN